MTARTVWIVVGVALAVAATVTVVVLLTRTGSRPPAAPVATTYSPDEPVQHPATPGREITSGEPMPKGGA